MPAKNIFGADNSTLSFSTRQSSVKDKKTVKGRPTILIKNGIIFIEKSVGVIEPSESINKQGYQGSFPG
jgi:hypothetical protein